MASAQNFFTTPLRTETLVDGWSLVFSVADLGPPASYVVEMVHHGAVKGRSSMSRPDLTEEFAVNFLRERAIKWIEQYQNRPHTGSSDFTPL
ncbi:MAG: hypothetical protein J0H69_08510 [Burkholderiales bacterium]|nr:hypothetical protein [Burkholderiales bacterium]